MDRKRDGGKPMYPFAQNLPEMLTPAELEALRLAAKETIDSANKAFQHLRPKPPVEKDE